MVSQNWNREFSAPLCVFVCVCVFCWYIRFLALNKETCVARRLHLLFLFFFNSLERASVPRVIAGTRICKLVTRSLVVDGHRVEVNPNSRVLRSIVSEEAHASPKSGVIKFLWERASFAAQTQSFLCGKFFTARLEVLPHSRHGGVFQMSTMVNFGIGLKRRWAFSLRLRKITGSLQCRRILGGRKLVRIATMKPPSLILWQRKIGESSNSNP